ncbi:MAG TPA: hypothetical protein EYH40_00410 [Desulfurococcales archaeon]|nr:hypothetical protein [Desulfurococcales archaeon]
MSNRGYIDLYIEFTSKSKQDQVVRLLQELSSLGYTGAAIACNIDGEFLDEKKIVEYFNFTTNLIREVRSKNVDIEVYHRLNIISDNIKFIKKVLRKFRRSFNIIGVNPCNSLNAARFAARDRRVDVIFFNLKVFSKFFDESQAKLMSSTGVFLEIPFNKLFRGRSLTLPFRVLRKTLQIAKKYNVHIVLSSAAHSIFDMISPLQLMSTLTVLGIGLDDVKSYLTLNPKFIIERSKHRMSRNHIIPGVDVIEGVH